MDGTTPSPEMAAMQSDAPWWRGAVIYQIYPRSYCDSNGDGIGDLPGITSKLDYIADLGVDGIWISPFYTSPMKDFGYDVADYCDIDPIFGAMADFEALIAKAHAVDLRVVIDQVFSHTSDQHAWFEESRQSRDNPKSDWYVWRDAKPDGSPPNNWQAVFGGPTWTWDARRQQYYMHNFLSSQPQLNVHNIEVQDALLAVARFWLDKGVDGFRLDAINFAMHDLEFRDNPPWDPSGRVITRPFDLQHHAMNQSHADIPKFLERIRGLLDGYGAVFTVAEIGGPDPIGEMRAFTSGETRLNSAYSFDFLYAETLEPARVKAAQANWMGDTDGEGWPSWAFSNHDAPRCISRWFQGEDYSAYAKLTNALLLSLRGNPIIYQGEELGLPQAAVPFELLQDPEAIANWPLTLGRDGARTPMPWRNDNTFGGFSEVEPWLPLGEGHADRGVEHQVGDPHSPLVFTQQMLTIRAQSDALRVGSLTFLNMPDPVLAFHRVGADGTVLCVFNLGASSVDLPADVKLGEAMITCGWTGQGPMPGHGIWIGRV